MQDTRTQATVNDARLHEGDGHICELRVDRNSELKNILLYAKGDEESFYMDVFVGELDRSLKVVR